MTEDHDTWIPDMALLLLNKFYLKTKIVHTFTILIKTLSSKRAEYGKITKRANISCFAF